jgi:hypothetical protein
MKVEHGKEQDAVGAFHDHWGALLAKGIGPCPESVIHRGEGEPEAEEVLVEPPPPPDVEHQPKD